MSVNLEIQELVQSVSGELLSLLLNNVAGINAALISTADGFELSSRQNNNANISKLSALSSSLSAIGTIATTEVEIGKQYQHVLIDSDEGFFIVMDIPYQHYPMTLCVVASKEVLFSEVFQQAKNLVNALTELLPQTL